MCRLYAMIFHKIATFLEIVLACAFYPRAIMIRFLNDMGDYPHYPRYTLRLCPLQSADEAVPVNASHDV